MDGIPYVTLSAPALVGIFVLLVATGRLVPRRTYDDKAHEAGEWRTEARIKDQQLMEKDKQLRHMSEVGETVKAIMRSMEEKAAREAGGEQP
jgi:hypothetical protein